MGDRRKTMHHLLVVTGNPWAIRNALELHLIPASLRMRLRGRDYKHCCSRGECQVRPYSPQQTQEAKVLLEALGFKVRVVQIDPTDPSKVTELETIVVV